MFYLGDGIAEKCSQGLCHFRHAVKTCKKCFAADSFQGIVQKVRVDLVLKCQVFCLFFGNIDQIILVNHFIKPHYYLLSLRSKGMAHMKQIIMYVAHNKLFIDFMGFLVGNDYQAVHAAEISGGGNR